MSASPSPQLDDSLRNVPTQLRSRDRLRRVLDAAEALLASEGADAFTIGRIAAGAGVPVGSVYHYFPGKEAIVEALAVRHWTDFAELVRATADADERSPLPRPAAAVLDALADGFRSQPGFLALWFGGLRSERVRDVTRPIREDVGRSVARMLAVHWPHATREQVATVARLAVVAGDALLREAFRATPDGDPVTLEEGRALLEAYLTTRLGSAAR